MEITESGRSMHSAGRVALESTTRALFASSNEDERKSLRRILEMINEH
jgi:hypothetical protein